MLKIVMNADERELLDTLLAAAPTLFSGAPEVGCATSCWTEIAWTSMWHWTI